SRSSPPRNPAMEPGSVWRRSTDSSANPAEPSASSPSRVGAHRSFCACPGTTRADPQRVSRPGNHTAGRARRLHRNISSPPDRSVHRPHAAGAGRAMGWRMRQGMNRDRLFIVLKYTNGIFDSLRLLSLHRMQEADRFHETQDQERSMSVINTEIKPFKAQAYKNGKFIEVTDETLKGKWSVVVFYPADFTFVCPTELEDLADHHADFEKLGIEIYSVSTDTHFSHKAWHDTSDAI